MPRGARRQSASGVYHIMLRGINRQQIFMDAEDNEKFLYILGDCKKVSGFKLYAYCLMGNHIHLLLRPDGEPLAQIFRRIGSRFVHWYNQKYQRCGHLFQDRYKSEPVEDDGYFLAVIRYIHQNPVKAGMCAKPEYYRYSSYGEYVGIPKLADVETVYEMVSKKEFIDFNNTCADDVYLDMESDSDLILNDLQIEEILKQYLHINGAERFCELDESEQAVCLRFLRDNGAAIRQICRVTGISYYKVRKSVAEERTVPLVDRGKK